MRCQNLLHNIVVIMVTITLSGLLGCGDTKDPMPVTPSENETAEGAAILSGRVVDLEARPVAGLALAIQPFEVDDSTGGHTYVPALVVKTDDTGHFSITDIYHDEFQFMLAPDDQSHVPFDTEYEIISIKIGDFAYHPNENFPSAFNSEHFLYHPRRPCRKCGNHSSVSDAGSRENCFCQRDTAGKQGSQNPYKTTILTWRWRR